jgi:hypothetical protein
VRDPIFPLVLCLGNALSLAFQHDFSLKLSDASNEIEQEPAGRGVRVEVHGKDTQGGLLLFQSLGDPDEVWDGSCQAIQFGHDEDVELPRRLQPSRSSQLFLA